jgi:hypothetical protein
MGATYRVTAPYITLKIMDPVAGTPTMLGFYEDARVAGDRVEAQSLQRHLDRGWIEPVEESAGEPAPALEGPEPDPNKVPEGTADEVKTWVGEDVEKAKRALAAEQKLPSPRKTLVDHLMKVATPTKTEK